MKRALPAALALCATLIATAAAAEFVPIRDEAKFVQIVADKTLTRPLVSLSVAPTGRIAGSGAAWEVTGQWTWQNGYFCRDLSWGGTDLGYNCQEVRVRDNKIRFISDRGTGEYADFRLR
jgi:hypothetical protein